MSNIDTVRVDLGARSYDILVGENLLEQAADHMGAVLNRPRTFIVTDENVAALHLQRFQDALSAGGIESEAIILPAGEQTKSMAQLDALLDKLMSLGVERKDMITALGGGVIGDLTGFAASVLRRGVDFIQVPTTLLSQVDSSVGGKTGINCSHGKNLIGAFHQPRLVLADISVLDTLPKRQLLGGYAEVVKYGLIDDPLFFTWLEQHGKAVIDGDVTARKKAVVTSCKAKARIVAEDEKESGKRALLNLGHTFAHAFEAATGFGEALLHGEGVAIGMCMAMDLSVNKGWCPDIDASRARAHLEEVGLHTTSLHLGNTPFPAEQMYDYMKQDKKVSDGKITFVVSRGIGKAFLSNEPAAEEVKAVLAAG